MTHVIHSTVDCYSRSFSWDTPKSGSGFGWSCDKDGNLLEPVDQMNPAARANWEMCQNGHDINGRVIVDDGVEHWTQPVKECGCGSGEWPEPLYDGHGIFLDFYCRKCEKKVMHRIKRTYRSDIFSHYESEEQIEEDY